MASEYHVAVDGDPRGDGSESDPWDLQTALCECALVRPGDIIWVHGGEYFPTTTRRGFSGSAAYISELAGVEGDPIVVRSVPGERVAIDARLISEAGLVGHTLLEIGGSHTWWWGLEIRDSSPLRWTDIPGNAGPRAMGVYSNQPGTKLINCVIHDTGTGVFESGATGAEMYGNFVYHTGWNAPDRPHGPGFYIRNRSDPNQRKTLRDNVVMLTARHGWQAFGSGENSGNYFIVEGNVWIRNGEMFGQWVRGIQIVPPSDIVGTEIEGNYSWFSPGFGNHRVEVGSTGLRVKNNRFAGRISLQVREPLVDEVIEGNRFYSGTQVDRGTGFVDVEWPGNEYGPGVGVELFLQPNRYEEDRLLAVVFNWEHANEVDIDLSAYDVRAGDAVQVSTGEDLVGEPRMFRYREALRLPMTGWHVVAPAGMAALPSSLPEFGVFVLRLKRAQLYDPGEHEAGRESRKAARLQAWQRPTSRMEQKQKREQREKEWQGTVSAERRE